MNNQLLEMLNEILPQGSILLHEPLKKHTTFRIGGEVDCFLEIGDLAKLQQIIPLLTEYQEPFFLLGNGSNLLVSDKGFRGTILHLSGEFTDLSIHDREIMAGAGLLLSSVAKFAAEKSLTGMEFAAGIPGTIGGAIMMNAGAYGGEMKQIVKNVMLMTKEGDLLSVSGEDMAFGYRTSRIKNSGDIVLSVTLELQSGDQTEILSVMKDLAEKRREKQPLEYPSAGSTFKRPEGNFAGKLIMDSGLRGFQIGGAQVAEKHCGFVINRDNASAKDVVDLMRHIRDTVEKDSGIRLEKEIIFLGEFDENY